MLLALVLPLLTQTVPAPGPGSAIVFVLDDVAAADLALYGGPVATPTLAGLAAQGVRFDQAIGNPACQPSRRSLLFGHWWTTNSGESCGGAALPSQDVTLADWCMPRRLPATAKTVFLGKWHLGGPTTQGWAFMPQEHGFDHWQSGMPGNLPGCGGEDYSDWARVSDGVLVQATTYEPFDIRDRAKFWWETHAGKQRVYIVSLALAHAPFHVPPAELLPPGYVVGGFNRAKFEAMVIAADTLIGQVLEAVDLETTLVIVTGDNGTPPNATPTQGKSKTTCFERGIRVPLILAGGMVACPGRSSAELVHLVDLYATLVEWGGGTMPEDSLHPVKGLSLLPTLLEPTVEDHAYHEMVLSGTLWPSSTGDGERCARSRLWKLRQRDLDGNGQVDTEELYNLAADPGETVNVIGANQAQAELMRAWIEAEAP